MYNMFNGYERVGRNMCLSAKKDKVCYKKVMIFTRLLMNNTCYLMIADNTDGFFYFLIHGQTGL